MNQPKAPPVWIRIMLVASVICPAVFGIVWSIWAIIDPMNALDILPGRSISSHVELMLPFISVSIIYLEFDAVKKSDSTALNIIAGGCAFGLLLSLGLSITGLQELRKGPEQGYEALYAEEVTREWIRIKTWGIIGAYFLMVGIGHLLWAKKITPPNRKSAEPGKKIDLNF